MVEFGSRWCMGARRINLTFDNLVLEFTSQSQPFGTWRDLEKKIILRVAKCGDKEFDGLFETCLWTINHESIYGCQI
jgi:hypothetical protein